MGCFYCENGEELNKLMIPVMNLKASRVLLVRNQNFPGRVVVQYKDHKTEMFQLTPEELHDFSDDVAVSAQAIMELFQADKINYGIFGDGVPHLHVHIIPKKQGEYCWGGQFDMNGQPDFPSEEIMMERVKLIREKIEELSK